MFVPSDAMEAAAHLFAAACNRRLGGVAHSPQHYCDGTPHAAEPASSAAGARFKKSNAVATLEQNNIYHCKPPLQARAAMQACAAASAAKHEGEMCSGAHISMYRTVCVPLCCFFLICPERTKIGRGAGGASLSCLGRSRWIDDTPLSRMWN